MSGTGREAVGADARVPEPPAMLMYRWVLVPADTRGRPLAGGITGDAALAASMAGSALAREAGALLALVETVREVPIPRWPGVRHEPAGPSWTGRRTRHGAVAWTERQAGGAP